MAAYKPSRYQTPGYFSDEEEQAATASMPPTAGSPGRLSSTSMPRPPTVDPKQAYRQGWKQDLLSNLMQQYRPFTSGGAMQSSAQQTNYQNARDYEQQQ